MTDNTQCDMCICKDEIYKIGKNCRFTVFRNYLCLRYLVSFFL